VVPPVWVMAPSLVQDSRSCTYHPSIIDHS
jgi:hypothetical protein